MPSLLDPVLLREVAVADASVRVQPTAVSHESWAWSYLTVCLATEVGLDEALEIVRMVMFGGGGS